MTSLIACEYSQTVCSAILRRGREAISNDLLMTDGNPDWHIQGSCEDAIMSRRWNMIVIHIPCTAMAVAGNSTYGLGMRKDQERLDAIEWTLKVWDMAVSQADCVALENPASVIFPILRDTRGADVQYIQPWQFGHPEMKKTGFALWRLPRLKPTKNVYAEMMALPRKERERIHFMSPGPDRAKERARFLAALRKLWPISGRGRLSRVSSHYSNRILGRACDSRPTSAL